MAQVAQIVQIVRLVLALMPVLIDAVKAVEDAFPESGQGKAKLAAVRGILLSAYTTGADLATTFDQAWPALESAVGAVVALCNSTGQFKKATA